MAAPSHDRVAVTDAAGRYRFDPLPPDMYTLWADKDGYTMEANGSFVAVPGEMKTAGDLRLIHGGLIVGRVVDADTGRPFIPSDDKAAPWFLNNNMAMCEPLPPRSDGRGVAEPIENDGSFRLRAAPGSYHVYLRIYNRSQVVPPAAIHVDVAEGQTVTVDFKVRKKPITDTAPSNQQPDRSLPATRSSSGTATIPEGTDPSDKTSAKPDTSATAPSAKTAAELLREFKEEKVAWKQGEIARKLIATGDKTVVPEIARMLTSEDRHIRCNAGWVLAALGDERGLPAVLAELKDTSDRPVGPERRRSDGTPYVAGQIKEDHYYAAWVLEKIGDRRAVPALIEALQDEAIDYQAAIVLAHLGDQRAVPALLAALELAKGDQQKRGQSDMRLWAGYALMALRHPVGFKTMVDFLNGGHDDELRPSGAADAQTKQLGVEAAALQRRYAAEAFVEFPDKAAIPFLIRATTDKDIEVRVNAIAALGKTGDGAALPTLRALLADSGKETGRVRLRNEPPLFQHIAVREAAAHAIEDIVKAAGTDAKESPGAGKDGGAATKKSSSQPSAAKPAIEMSPAKDQPATKAGSKAESRSAPAGGLTAERNTEEASVLAIVTKWDGTVLFETNPGKPTVLSLARTQITDAGLADSEGLIHLPSLDLTRTNITDAGLEHIKGLAMLQSLNLNGTKVTDVGLIYLKGLANLQWLDLGQTKITDAGLEHLNGLTHLKKLYLGGSQVTDVGVNGRRKALPSCEIITGKNPTEVLILHSFPSQERDPLPTAVPGPGHSPASSKPNDPPDKTSAKPATEMPPASDQTATKSQPALNPERSQTTFKARLPSGVTVEFLGVSDNPSLNRPWWRPDGSPLAERPYDSLGDTKSRGKDEIAREFAVRLGNLPSEPEAVGTSWELGLHLGLHETSSWSRGNPMRLGTSVDDLRAMFARVPAATKTLTVRFGLAAGPWDTLLKCGQRGNMGVAPGTRSGVIFAEPIENTDKTIVAQVSYRRGYGQERIVAVDNKGQEHTASSTHNPVAADVAQLTAVFSDLSLKEIKEFRFQSRPYQWVEFRNVSLQPGEKADVKIGTDKIERRVRPGDDSSTSSIPIPGKTVESAAVSPPIAKQAKEQRLPERTLRVHFVDVRGRPIAGVKVFVNPVPAAVAKKPREIINRDYVSDVDGLTVVELPKTLALLRIWAHQEGFVPTFAHWEQPWFTAGRAAPEEISIVLKKGTTIGGVVKNQEGLPIVGAKVGVQGPSNVMRFDVDAAHIENDMWLACGDDAPVTDAAGRWTLTNVPEGDDLRLRLSVTHPDYISDSPWGGLQGLQDVTLASLRKQKATIVMSRGIPSKPTPISHIQPDRHGVLRDASGRAIGIWGVDGDEPSESDE